MPRILFEKKGSAVWISHLDLMRLFQRAFKRANLQLKHTQGFNPRPSVSIALPLSVGVESSCELLDFDLDGENVPCEEIAQRLNKTLVSGVKVLACYEGGRKVRDLSLLQCRIMLEYDSAVPADAVQRLSALFSRDELTVAKKTKNGIQDQNISPMVKRLNISLASEQELSLDALICCQNPTLNPAQIVAAIEKYAPELKPEHGVYSRIELYDHEEVIFR